MKNCILSLNDTTLNLLKQKHPCQSEPDKQFLFDDIPEFIHKIKYECINAEVFQNTTLRTRGGSVPSGMVGGEYSHPIVLVRASPTYVWP